MSSREYKFWTDFIATSNPGWTVQLDAQWGQRGSRLSDLKVFLYVFDTGTEWKAACATSTQDMEKARQHLQTSGSMRNAVKDTCGSLIRDAADQNGTADSELAKKALMLSMVSMTDTRTFAVVQERLGSTAGHWLTILYRLADGTILTRPAFVQAEQTKGLLSPEKLKDWAREIALADTSNPSTSVYKMIHSSGGAMLASW